MFWYFFLLFTILPALELAVLIKVGTHIGVLNTLLLLFLTGIAGAALARMQGFYVLNQIQENLNRGIMPSSELLDGVMILAGGILLLTPGLITDTFGFLLLIPWTRTLIKFWLKKKFEAMMRNGQTVNISFWDRQPKRFDDIDI